MTESDSPTAAVTPQLDPVQARVLACLIEKEATTPEQYPLTANAVLVACNQKTARDPVLELEPGAVGHALRTLEAERLVRSIHGSRAQRYDHRTDDVYQVSPEQRVVLALLILRGPQTAGELFARSERLHRFADTGQVQAVLDRLAQRRLVLRLARAPGQREERHAHLLCGTDALPVAGAAGADEHDAPGHAGGRGATAGGLQARVDALEAALAALEARVDRLDGGAAGDPRGPDADTPD
jgi:uncharacterized protein YceH (UPF0502 family)